MTIAINGSGTITGISVGGLNDNIITKNEMATGGAWAPAGTVLQVVNAYYNTQTSLSLSTWVDSGVTATITPSSASNKILCLVNMQGASKNGTSNAYMAFRLLRNSTSINYIEGEQGYTGSTTTNSTGGSGNTYLDSPATTSAVVYKVQVSNSGNSGTVIYCANNVLSTITLMEIAA